MAGTEATIWNALIRTHHITSRKKVARLRQAAVAQKLFVLLRSGRPPGIMYAEGSQTGVEIWVTAVQKLRYKDFQLASRPAKVVSDISTKHQPSGLFETDSVKKFGIEMQHRGQYDWWRKAMGFAGYDDRI